MNKGRVTTVRLPVDIDKKLKIRAKIDHRTVTNEIEVCLRLALTALENPDLPLNFIKSIMESQAEKEMGLQEEFSV